VVSRAAYDVCSRLARQHYENFPVASVLLPRAARRHVAAIYAFARVADDFADEGDRPAADRLADLDAWSARLEAAAGGHVDDDGSDHAAIFTALAETMRECHLDATLFHELLSAFRQDVTVHRYESWRELLDYCRRSANPVGRLVLRVCGYGAGPIDRHADALCTALQLTNFWQDVESDWRRGRLYVPLAVAREVGADEADLARGELSPAWRAALACVASPTRELFERGRAVADDVRGRLRWELRATWLGGVRILDALEGAGFDVYRDRPTLGWSDAASIAWQALTWRWPERSLSAGGA
jgi:squalene synthase HpnC